MSFDESEESELEAIRKRKLAEMQARAPDEEQVEKAEEIVKDLREALAAVMEADEAVPETQDQQVTKAHTEKAVEQREACNACCARSHQ